MPKGNELFGMMWQSHTPIELFGAEAAPACFSAARIAARYSRRAEIGLIRVGSASVEKGNI